MSFVNWLGRLFTGKNGGKTAKNSLDYNKLIDLGSLFDYSDTRADLNATFETACEAGSNFLSKIQPRIEFKEGESPNKKYLNYLFQVQPNEAMTAPRFYNALGYSYLFSNLAIMYLQWDSTDKNRLTAIYPLDVYENNVNLAVSQQDGKIYGKFFLPGYGEKTVDGEDLVIIQRNASIVDLLKGRSKAIDASLKVIQADYGTAEKQIKLAQYLKYTVKFGTVYGPDVVKAKTKSFTDSLESSESGVAVIPNDMTEFKPIERPGKWMDSADIEGFKDDIYRYLGTSRKIAEGTFNEDEYQSYYERTLEPFCIQLQAELNAKLLSRTEYDQGNRIVVSTDPLQTASLKTRISIATAMESLPMIVPNDVLKLLHQPTYEGGEKPQASLNWVSKDKQDQYQGVGSSSGKKKTQEDN